MEKEEYYQYKNAVMLWRIVPPILLIFGTVGNSLTIVVLTNKTSRQSSTSMFLSALAFSDILALITGLLRQWITYTFGVDIRMDLSELGCRFHFFFVYLVTQFSSWMLICVTTERVLSSWFPHRRSVACNMKTALVAIIIIAVCLIILNCHYLFGNGTLQTDEVNSTITVEKCVPLTESYAQFLTFQWTWIDLFVFYLAPMTVLIIGNSAIIYKVFGSQRRIQRAIAPVPISTVQKPTTSTDQVQLKPRRSISSLTITLFMVSVVFVVCITPIVVIPIGEPYWADGASPEKLAVLFLMDTLANLFMYVNHSVNFLLYFLSGSKFRKEIKIICCQRYTMHATLNDVLAQHSRSESRVAR